jgi:hypothetical protein
MRSCRAFLYSLLVLGTLGLQAQPLVGPRWMVSSRGLMGQPAANVSAREMERLERYLVFGASYCNVLAAQQYAANLAVARGMSTYLASVSATAVDLQARAAAQRVAAAFSSFPCAYQGKQLPVIPPVPPKPGDAPFSQKAPDLGKVPDEEQEMAADLVIRYDTDAARSAITWKNAETMRLSLTGRGMSLNAATASAFARLQPLYDEAAGELRDHKWDDALSTLKAAEATTDKIATVVGK